MPKNKHLKKRAVWWAIIDGKKTFWPCKNIAEGKLEFFVIDPDDWAECEDRGASSWCST